MILRKINAVLGLVTTLVLMNHAICHAAWMLFRVSLVKSPNSLPWVMVVFMVAHAVISIVLAILGHKGAEKHKCKNYPQMNKATMIQRASGVSLILLTALHIVGAAGLLQPPQLVHAILPPIFFAVTLLHTAISTSKAFVTLGIGSATFVKTVDIAVKVLCGVILIADIVGFYLYAF